MERRGRFTGENVPGKIHVSASIIVGIFFSKKGSYLSEYEYNEVFTTRQWDLIRAFHDLSKGIQRDLTAKDCDELCTLSQRE